MGAAASSELGEKLIGRLRTLHALKRGAPRMFDPMLAAVAVERDGGEMEPRS